MSKFATSEINAYFCININQPKEKVRVEHILIIRFSAMSDVIMAVPVVYSLAMQYPHLRITVLSSPYARVFFDGIAPNVGFMGADIRHEYHGMKGLNALYRRLQAKNFTAIADLHSVLRSSYLRMRFNLDRYRVEHIDKHRAGRRDLINKHQMVQQPSSFQNYADVLARLGYPVELNFTSIFPKGGGDLGILPSEIGMKETTQQWIGMAPFAKQRGKVYPTRLMEQVISGIIDNHSSSRIFLFGMEENERKQIDEWQDKYKNCVNASALSGGLNGELIIMSHLDVMVSMDSEYMHLASLTATPVVSIWGATHPFAGFMGWNQQMSNAVQADMPCRPCSINGNKSCMRGDYACLANIAPKTIIDRVESILG